MIESSNLSISCLAATETSKPSEPLTLMMNTNELVRCKVNELLSMMLGF